ncbi:hypothetical protein [Micromonospora tulbaghiae]
MSDPFEGLLRSTLTDIAEEAPTVQDSLTRAERRVRNRRRNTVAAGAAGILAVLVIGAPFAYASRGDDPVITPQPGTSAPQPDRTEPVPAPPDVASPVPVIPEDPTRPDSAVPAPPGVASPVPAGPEGPSMPASPVPAPPGVRSNDPVGPSPSPVRR